MAKILTVWLGFPFDYRTRNDTIVSTIECSGALFSAPENNNDFLGDRVMRSKSVFVVVILFVAMLGTFVEQVQANLVHIDGWVYRTGSGTDSLYWYFDMKDLTNKTWSEQVFCVSFLEEHIEGIEDNWHIATEEELQQLLVLNGNSEQNREVVDILGPSPFEDNWYARYNKPSPFPSIDSHYQTKLKKDGYVSIGLTSVLDIDRWPHCGAWVVTESPPYIRAEADGPYVIDVDETVLLDNSSSYSNCGIDELRWRIDGQDVGAFISYDTLFYDLGLGLGTHEVELRAGGGGVYDYDYTTIEIVPEPTTLLLLGFGAVVLKRRIS